MIFTKIGLNHYDFIENDDLPIYEKLDGFAWFSLENWFLEGCLYEIEIYSWWWLHDFENLIMTWFMILMRRDEIAIETLDDLN